MGIIITKFGKKKSTYEVLEKLENEIQTIEEFRRNTEQTQKKMIGRFIFISVCVYCITALVLYFYFFPASAYERIMYIIPLVTTPILLILLKSLLTWYYNRKILCNQRKISTLRNEKKKILEEVMDKETYKVAKNILDKFAPEQVKKYNNFSIIDNTPVNLALVPSSSTNTSIRPGLRYRGQAINNISQLGTGQASNMKYERPPRPPYFVTPTSSKPSQQQSIVPTTIKRLVSPGTPLRLPRAILPRDRSVLDKMVDYLVGDGPSNRFALICKNCSSHNGMALREEFEYLSFRCCYCSTLNPARKKKPAAPKLDSSVPIDRALTFGTDSDQNSDTNSESEVGGPIVTQPEDNEELSNRRQSISMECDKVPDVEMKSLYTEFAPMETSSPGVVENTEKKSDSDSAREEEPKNGDT